MNRKIEIQKIKVNSGQELIAKAKEYKSSGGEWKLREKYYTGPGKGNNKRNWEWGIIISNGKQKIDIKSLNNNEVDGRKLDNDDCCGSKFLTNVLDMDKAWDELCQVFPEVAPSRKKHDRSLPFKKIKENGEDYFLIRYLVAENSWHLKKILFQYVQDNKTKIYQSANPHFSGWVKIVDGQDGNMYLYVGEKNDGGGQEIKIGIKKEEFYVKESGSTYSHEEMLELNWNLFTITRPRTSAETHEYYSKSGGLEEEWQRNWPHHEKLCRKYLEELRERLNERLEYWKKQPSPYDEGMCMVTTTIVYIDAIDHELERMKYQRPDYYAACDKDCAVCGIKLCCHFEGKVCSGDKYWARADEDLRHYLGPIPEPERKKNNQIGDTEKKQLLQYFLTHSIAKITLDNDKLVIKYNNSQQIETKEADNQELEKYRKFVQNQPNHSLSLKDLQQQIHSNPSQTNPNPDNSKLAIGLTVGAIVVVLVGVVSFYLGLKKNKK